MIKDPSFYQDTFILILWFVHNWRIEYMIWKSGHFWQTDWCDLKFPLNSEKYADLFLLFIIALGQLTLLHPTVQSGY